MKQFFLFLKRRGSRARCIHEDVSLREHLSERQVDKMLADSFPASDPSSTY